MINKNIILRRLIQKQNPEFRPKNFFEDYFKKNEKLIPKNVWDYWEEFFNPDEPTILVSVPLSLCIKSIKKDSDDLNKKVFRDFLIEFEASKKILDLKEDWDGNGSIGYSNETFERVKSFLISLAMKFWEDNSLILPVPYINPGLNGAIDLHWKTDKFEILLSVPEDEDESINYYGDNFGKIRMKGTLDTDNLDSFLAFIKRYY